MANRTDYLLAWLISLQTGREPMEILKEAESNCIPQEKATCTDAEEETAEEIYKSYPTSAGQRKVRKSRAKDLPRIKALVTRYGGETTKEAFHRYVTEDGEYICDLQGGITKVKAALEETPPSRSWEREHTVVIWQE